ncbi:MAG: transglutaminaseTgpA domain-containing protein, partial [Holophagae bacterium]
MNRVTRSRRMLGWTLLWAMVPLPFLYIVLAPFWIIAGAAGLFLVLWPERVVRPSTTVLNLLALLILVVVVGTGGLHVGPLRPLGHLLLLLTAVRVLLVDDHRSFVRALALVGMVWVVSVSASTHMAVSIYFVASAVILWWVGMWLNMTGLGIDPSVSALRVPRLRHVATASFATLVIAVPFFVAMPRLGSPWVAGSSFARSTGFSPDVDLGKLGRVTVSQEVALVLRAADGGTIRRDWTRLRGTAFDQVMAGSWMPRRTNLRPLDVSRGVSWLRPEVGTLDGSVELDVSLLRPRHYLMIPPGTIAVQAPTELALDPYGGLFFGYRRGEPLNYRIWVSGATPPRAAPPSARDTRLPRSDPRVRQLADQVAGNVVGAAARADAVERYLQANYRYALSSGIRIQTDDPVAWFLFDGREGHCEFFAGSMVVLLRHLGVPARMVAGYSGGDLSPDGDELVVRESNAHAWVEVWLGVERGWVTYDPTPAVGVPGLAGMTGAQRLRW